MRFFSGLRNACLGGKKTLQSCFLSAFLFCLKRGDNSLSERYKDGQTTTTCIDSMGRDESSNFECFRKDSTKGKMLSILLSHFNFVIYFLSRKRVGKMRFGTAGVKCVQHDDILGRHDGLLVEKTNKGRS